MGTYYTAWGAWGTWNTIYESTSTTRTFTWRGWNQGYVTLRYDTSTTSATGTWAAWNTDLGMLQTISNAETAAQRQARIDREQTARQEREAAQARAWRLLRRHLRPDQRKTLRDERYFDVLVGDARRRYRIREGIAGNVTLLGPDGRPLRRYCIHPQEDVPVADVLLGQMLMLRYDEAEFLRVANGSAA